MSEDEAFEKLLARFDAVLDKCERIALAAEALAPPKPHVHAVSVDAGPWQRCTCGDVRIRLTSGEHTEWGQL